MSPADQTPDRAAFQQVVDKLSANPGFMAHLLRLAFGGDMSAARIAQGLGCTQDAALRLAMMRTPATDRDGFRRDVAKMAGDVGIEVAGLAATIRQARALSAFDAPATAGLLMAARDNLNDDEER